MRLWTSESESRRARRDQAGSGDEPAGATGEVPDALTVASAGIAGIVAAAESATQAMREADSRTTGDTASGRDQLVAELSSSLLKRTESLEEDARELNAILERARSQLGVQSDAPSQAPAAARELPDVAQEAEPRPPKGPQDAEGPQPPLTMGRFKPRGVSLKGTPRSLTESGRSTSPEGARLLATQMAVAGSDRSEIEQRLATEFGVGDPGPLVDEIFQEDS